jgi:hypothetical protein
VKHGLLAMMYLVLVCTSNNVAGLVFRRISGAVSVVDFERQVPDSDVQERSLECHSGELMQNQNRGSELDLIDVVQKGPVYILGGDEETSRVSSSLSILGMVI